MSTFYRLPHITPMRTMGGTFGFRDDLLPFFDKKMPDGRGGKVSLHILFERLDARRNFDEMLTLLTKKDENGFMKMGEFLACHVKVSNMPGFAWNCVHPEHGIKLLIDIMPVAGARSVRIKNLERRPELNEKIGVVRGLKDLEEGRFAVSVQAFDGEMVVLVRASNLDALE